MDVKELRVGNYISYNFKMQGWNDVEVCTNDFCSGFKDSKFMSKNYKPIPLTEEWLLDFGFTGLGCGEYKKGNILLDNEYTDKGVWYVLEDSSLLNINVIHVHQLQNLHFALTNEELTNK